MKKLRSEYFLVTRKTFGSDGKPEMHSQIELQFAVPKKLLKRAVDRNAVRRVARESWRAAILRAGDSFKLGTGVHEVRIRLLSRPKSLAELSRPARKRFWRVELDQLLSKMVT